ncbi:hypothetical protein Y032_0025g1253 [Ancylostoma ceylanicum]|uniref:EGF-like domain protein n=1 Tax=Ancylostoma ceylanicum TaxID=53326 RepID=A0A016UXN1_9BILA|nr:hypothetical protein Y032_0025g1253 [Ancylostoma ceylanicum]
MNQWILRAVLLLSVCLNSATAVDYDEPCYPYACEFGECIPEGSSFRCECRKDHVGETCNIWRSPLVNCDVDGPFKCFNGGICNTTKNSFTCICPPNFTEDVDECETSPCQNGGTCVNRPGSFYCMCPPGFKGETCSESVEVCSAGTCQNGGTCIDSVDGYVCQCSPGFLGSRCERTNGIIRASNGKTRKDPNKCAGCVQKAGNGKCDEECNVPECSYDGNDCLVKDPFARCPNSSFCALMFKNGVCDEVCNNEACLFDGFDCMAKEPVCPESISAYCKKHKSDGICDEQCNQERCDFDGGDCQGISNKILSGELSVVVLADPSYFVANAPRFLRSLSKMLRAGVRIKRDQKGLMIFVWKDEKIGQRVEIDKLEVASDARRTDKRGVIVWIEVDVTGCVEECFSDVEVVASFIEAGREKLTDMNMTIYSADAKRPRNGRTSFDVSLLILLACITVMIVIAILFIVHERPSRKRKVIENAPVWVPPTELENEKSNGYTENNWQRRVILESAKRRRIDHSELKLLEEQLTPRGPKVPRVFVLPKAKKIEPLPSRLHIEAASANPISIPIAAEDVNQRGPNGRTPVMVLVRNTTKTEEQIIEDLTRLRSAGADLNLWDDYDDTALHVAVSSDRSPLVRKLLQLGASPVIRDHKNSTCLHLAARMCSLDMVKALLEIEEMKMEVDAVDDDNRTALMLVATHDRVDAKIAEALCAAGAKVNYDGDNTLNTWTGRTALHFAAKYDNAQMVAFLLGRNANKDCQDHECCTPLHLAASEGHEGPVKELIKAGASVMLRNDKSQTPYDTALVNNHAGVAALLASGDNLRVQLYSNNGEIFASSTPPGFKCAKLLMARHSRSARVHAASRASPKSTQSTPTRHPQNASSPHNVLATTHSMGSMFCSPQFSSTTPRSMDHQYTSPRHMQPIVYSAPQTVSKVPESAFHSPQYDTRPLYFEAEKSATAHSSYMDSGFGTFTDGSAYDHNGHWSMSSEPMNRSVLSPHERFVCNEGYIV